MKHHEMRAIQVLRALPDLCLRMLPGPCLRALPDLCLRVLPGPRPRSLLGPCLLVLLSTCLLTGCGDDDGPSPPDVDETTIEPSIAYPPTGAWDDEVSAAQQDTLHLSLYELGTEAQAPYLNRPSLGDTVSSPAATQSVSGDEPIALTLDAVEEDTWWRLFSKQGTLLGAASLRLSPDDRECGLPVMLVPEDAQGNSVVAFAGIAASEFEPFPEGFTAAAEIEPTDMFFPIAIENTDEITGVTLRFHLSQAQQAVLYADPGSRLYGAAGASNFDTADLCVIESIETAGAGCNLFCLTVSPAGGNEGDATVPPGSDILFYIVGRGETASSGLCIDPEGALFTQAGTAGVEPEVINSTDCAVSCSLAVLVPGGGESICTGEEVEIAWSTSDCCGIAVKVELLLDGQSCIVIADSTENDGVFPWTAAQCAGEAAGYRIRVTDLAGGSAGESEDTFTINPGCSVALSSPNGGESFSVGDMIAITWSASNCCGDSVGIELLRNGEQCLAITEAAPNSGTYQFIATQCAAETDGYTVRVIDTASGASDESDAPFTIYAEVCAITVTAPGADDLFCVDEEVSISWSFGSACGSTVAIDLLRDSEECQTIAAEAPNSGAYTWAAAQCDAASEGYAIRVTDLASGNSGQSSGSFGIESGCGIVVTSPAAGDTLCADEEIGITWSASGCCGETVSLALVRDSTICQTIAAEVPNSGSCAWTVSQCDGQTSNYAVMITDLSSEQSGLGGSFTILDPCSLTITPPAGGAALCAGEEVTISWESTACCGDAVQLELLRNGQACLTIADATANDAAHTWIAAQCDNETDGYGLRITDLASERSAETQQTFVINPSCAMTVTAPQPGEAFCSGQDLMINWEYGTCCDTAVTIELLRSGQVEQTIAGTTPNNGTYDWTIDHAGSEVDSFSVRITEVAGGVSAESAPFSIDPGCWITVTAPEQPSTQCAGRNLEIAWVKSVCCGATATIALYCTGELCTTIAEATGNDGSFDWTVASCGEPGDSCCVRVTDDDSGAYSESAAFVFADPCSLSVTVPQDEDVFCVNSDLEILWDTTVCCDSTVTIDLRVSGFVYAVIAESAPNMGSYTWTVAQEGDPGDPYTIRVTETEGSTYSESGYFFIHTDDVMEVTAPLAGAAFCEGDDVQITWRAACCDTTIDIQLFSGGSPRGTIALGTANDSEHTWSAEPYGLQGDEFTIRITETEGSTSAESGQFTIDTECNLAITAPNGGESYLIGDDVVITWQGYVCCGPEIKIELLRNGALCATIASVTENAGSYSWTAAQCAGESDGYTIRLTTVPGCVTDVSDGTFQITSTTGMDLSGGVFIVHHPPNYSYTDDDKCEQYLDQYAISSFAEQNPRMNDYTSVWYVLAAWDSAKEFSGVQFGFGNFGGMPNVFEDWGPCWPDGGGIETSMSGWPQLYKGTRLIASAGSQWEGNFVPIYYFYYYAGMAVGTIPLGINPAQGSGGFRNTGTPPQWFSPDCYGVMGFRTAGTSCQPD